MNYQLPQIPERTKKHRKDGITMVMDKGLSNQEVKNFYRAYPGGRVYVTGGTAPLIIHHLD